MSQILTYERSCDYKYTCETYHILILHMDPRITNENRNTYQRVMTLPVNDGDHWLIGHYNNHTTLSYLTRWLARYNIHPNTNNLQPSISDLYGSKMMQCMLRSINVHRLQCAISARNTWWKKVRRPELAWHAHTVNSTGSNPNIWRYIHSSIWCEEMWVDSLHSIDWQVRC
jgi:hypothetical protein